MWVSDKREGWIFFSELFQPQARASRQCSSHQALSRSRLAISILPIPLFFHSTHLFPLDVDGESRRALEDVAFKVDGAVRGEHCGVRLLERIGKKNENSFLGLSRETKTRRLLSPSSTGALTSRHSLSEVDIAREQFGWFLKDEGADQAPLTAAQMLRLSRRKSIRKRRALSRAREQKKRELMPARNSTGKARRYLSDARSRGSRDLRL